MIKYIDISPSSIQVNSDLWEIKEHEGEAILQIVNNKVEDHIGGKVALVKQKMDNYIMKAEMRFLGHHLSEGSGGWFGFTMRAQDLENYELVWFMPLAEGENTVAYLSVAHGVVPWWTESYQSQEKGKAYIPIDDWFQAQVEVKGDEFYIDVEGTEIFSKRITYYLSEGYPGFYVGTATDAAFRRIHLERLK